MAAILAGRKYTAEKKLGPGAPKGNTNNSKSQLAENLPIDFPRTKANPTATKIGKAHGVSHDTVKKAEKYANAVDKLDKDGVVRC